MVTSSVTAGVPVPVHIPYPVLTYRAMVLGVAGWSFRVLRHEIHPEADEVWALGEIVAEIEGKSVTRQQFGSQKIKRSRSTGAPLDLGFDLKGASTDAMKKCASWLGVGLYLSRKAPAGGTRMRRLA